MNAIRWMIMQIMIGSPILIPYPMQKGLPESQDQTLAELRGVSGRINAIDSDLGDLTVLVYDSPDAHPLIAKHWTPSETVRKYRLLTVAAEAEQYVRQLAAEITTLTTQPSERALTISPLIRLQLTCSFK